MILRIGCGGSYYESKALKLMFCSISKVDVYTVAYENEKDNTKDIFYSNFL